MVILDGQAEQDQWVGVQASHPERFVSFPSQVVVQEGEDSASFVVSLRTDAPTGSIAIAASAAGESAGTVLAVTAEDASRP